MSIQALLKAYASGEAVAPFFQQLHAAIVAGGERPVWISLVPEARLMERAAEIERQRSAGIDLPLFGIPFAVKDNIDVAGIATTAACPSFAYVPDRSATAVERLEAAGAIVIGKTNLDQFATGLVGTRSPYGICHSVFSSAHVSGGSSSGSAVAVAAGLVPFALGTDTAGSGRVPAAFNNIVGLKPTKGLISTRGLVPACRTLDCISIFAGSVEDASLVLSIAQGFDAEDPYSRPAVIHQERHRAEKFRFGVPQGILPQGEDAAALHRQAIQYLCDLGGTPVGFDYAPFAEVAGLLYAGPWVAERLAALQARQFGDWPGMDPVVAGIVAGAARITAAEAFAGLYRLAELARQTAGVWDLFDVMLLPTAPLHPRIDEVAADPVGVNARLGAYTNFVNLLDYAAIAVPAGMQPNGLPYGVTLLAPAFADGALARLAQRFHGAWPNATIGATGEKLPFAAKPENAIAPEHVLLAVVGAHLRGQPLHHQLTSRDAGFVRSARTAAGYKLYALGGTVPAKPGLVRDPSGAGLIEVEVFSLGLAAFGSFTAEVPPPLAIGTVALEDGSFVKGFVCEPAALDNAIDITGHGGWRAWLESRG